MKNNKNLFNQIFEQFQTLNEDANEQTSLSLVPRQNQVSTEVVDDEQPTQDDKNPSSDKITEIAKAQLKILNDKFKDDENRKTTIDNIIKVALGESKDTSHVDEVKALYTRIKQALSE